jgi:hypothetical protein
MEIVVSLLAVLTISIKITQLKAIVDTLIKCIKNLENGLYYTTLLYDTLGLLFWNKSQLIICVKICILFSVVIANERKF